MKFKDFKDFFQGYGNPVYINLDPDKASGLKNRGKATFKIKY